MSRQDKRVNELDDLKDDLIADAKKAIVAELDDLDDLDDLIDLEADLAADAEKALAAELDVETDLETLIPEVANSRSGLSQYLEDISHFPRISYDEEIELAILIKAGVEAQAVLAYNNELGLATSKEIYATIEAGQKAKDKFINSNYRLVISIAKQYQTSCSASIAFLDLIQSGNLGLMKAVDRFDHTKGLRFSTYATWWIRQHIRRDLLNQSQLIRLPVHIQEWLAKIYMLEQSGKLSPDELAIRLNISPNKVSKLLQIRDTRVVVYLDRMVDKPESDGTLLDMVASPIPSPDLVQNADDREVRLFNLLSSRLTDREQYIITRRYGIVDGTPVTLNALGKELGITRERVRQIESKAMRKLRVAHISSAFKDLLVSK